MSRVKRITRPHNAVLLVLFAGFLLSVSAQTQESEPLIIKAKGHGKMISVVDDRTITSALVVLRPDGTALITVTADVLVQAQGTWKATAGSPRELEADFLVPALTYEPALYSKRRALSFLFRLRRSPALELVYLDQAAPVLLLENDENRGNDFFKAKEGQRARIGPAYDSR